MNRKRLQNKPSNGETNRSEEMERIPTAREVLEELFQLLEDYAPTWYTEQHHNRAVAALRGVAQIKPAESQKCRSNG